MVTESSEPKSKCRYSNFHVQFAKILPSIPQPTAKPTFVRSAANALVPGVRI